MGYEVTYKTNVPLVSKAEKQAVKSALEKIGKMVEKDSASLSPVDTGRLKNSMTAYPPEENYVIIGTDVEYALYVELGTSKMKPRPFLKTAVNNDIGRMKTIIEQEFGK
jgi:HK97 gp10 family phage protein